MSITVDKNEPLWHVEARGAVTYHDAVEFQAAIKDSLGEADGIEFDARAVTAIDVGVLQTLVALKVAMDMAGTSLSIVEPSDQFEKSLEHSALRPYLIDG